MTFVRKKRTHCPLHEKLCVPGWGYPAHWWHEVCEAEGSLWSWDYYEDGMQEVSSKNHEWIVVHSFGLYLLPLEILTYAKGIIWYGSFFTHLPFAKETAIACDHHLKLVLQKFARRMHFPSPPRLLPERLNQQKLLDDIHQIANFDYHSFWQKQDFLRHKIFCVSGSNDLIVKTDRTSQKITPFILENEGHMPDAKKGLWKQKIEYLMLGNNA